MKTLEKDRSLRYQSASTLASEIARFLTNRPVIARPPTLIYLSQKVLRRHKSFLPVIIGTVIFLSILWFTTSWAFRAERSRRTALILEQGRRQELLVKISGVVSEDFADPQKMRKRIKQVIEDASEDEPLTESVKKSKEKYATFDMALRSYYASAWEPPDLNNILSLSATVSVTVARDGKVVNAFITKGSGNELFDSSVMTALERVKSIVKFPDLWPDQLRTCTIKFRLPDPRKIG